MAIANAVKRVNNRNPASNAVRTGIVLIVLLAGCLGTPTNDTGDGSDASLVGVDSPVIQMEAPREAFRVTNTQREAFIAISPDGQEILACAHGSFERPSWMFASTDGGQTFSELQADVPGVAGDCEAAYAEDGTWAFLHSTVYGATVATTSDQGATWTINPLAILPPTAADRPWMTYVNNTLMITFQPGPVSPGHAGFVKSEDHGASWSQPAVISPVDTQPHVSIGRILHEEAAGLVHVPMYRGNEAVAAAGQGELEFGLATSADMGQTWTYEVLDRRAAAMSTPSGVTIAGDTIHWVYADSSLGDGPERIHDLIITPDGPLEPVLLGDNFAWPRPWGAGTADGSAYILWQQDRDSGARWRLDHVDAQGNLTIVSEDLVPGYSRNFAEYAAVEIGPNGPVAITPDLAGGGSVYKLSLPTA